jgi:hypothetical protein
MADISPGRSGNEIISISDTDGLPLSSAQGRTNVELRQLWHFVALVEEQSVIRAAEREQIVQSGLPNSIRALERSLGTVLCVRGTRPVRLTGSLQVGVMQSGEYLVPGGHRVRSDEMAVSGRALPGLAWPTS